MADTAKITETTEIAEITLEEIESGNIPQSMIDECNNGKGDKKDE